MTVVPGSGFVRDVGNAGAAGGDGAGVGCV